MAVNRYTTRQPFKAFYTIFTCLNLFWEIPFLLLYYIVPALRPHASWTYRQTICGNFLQRWFTFASTIEFQYPLSLDPGNEKERWANISPNETKFYRQPLDDAHVKPGIIGGLWHPHPYHRENDLNKTIILHLHGGAFVLSDAREMNCGFTAKTLHDATSAMVFCPDYRLASTSGNRFPAALQDALSSYVYLLDQGISPSNIILSGDSAGGNLAIGLLRYIGDNRDLFPASPRALLLWSPWVDLITNFQDLWAGHYNAPTEYMPACFLDWGRRAYKPPGMPASDPYLSPIVQPFGTETPIWIQVGSQEILRDTTVRFHGAMSDVRKGVVVLHETKDATHDLILVGQILGREDQAQEAAIQAAKFLGMIE